MSNPHSTGGLATLPNIKPATRIIGRFVAHSQTAQLGRRDYTYGASSLALKWRMMGGVGPVPPEMLGK